MFTIEMLNLMWTGLLETLYMTLISAALSYILGLPLGLVLVVTDKDGVRPCPALNRVLGTIVNALRSVPFLILLFTVLPVTRFLTGTTIGPTATIVPLTIAAAPFVARLIETCFLEVDRGVMEAARSFGASNTQIIFRVLIPEALPSIVLNVAVIAITLLGYSAMAGTVGGGGLGDLAVKYGYNRFQVDIMVYSVIILCLLVLLIQGVCNFLYKILR